MKKWKEREKRWNKSKQNKVARVRLRVSSRIRRARRKKAVKTVPRSTQHRSAGEKGLVAPVCFSLVGNTSETISFFEKVRQKIKNSNVNEKIFINIFHVETISADAIMYLIALIKNVRRVSAFKIRFEGNVPQNDAAREFIINAGFFNYVYPIRGLSRKQHSEHIQIQNSNNADSKLAGDVCDFVHRFSGAGRESTKRLYSTIIELMTNTHQHAYKEIKEMKDNWYIYVENTKEYVQFVFLDTGVGIPNTVRKRWYERFGVLATDAKYIHSALRGEFRTETKLPHRGEGLPQIYEDASKGELFDLCIISNKGMCCVNEAAKVDESELNDALTGTLFSWRFSKQL